MFFGVAGKGFTLSAVKGKEDKTGLWPKLVANYYFFHPDLFFDILNLDIL